MAKEKEVAIVIVPDIIKAKFNKELAESGFQKIQNKVDSLIFNEDNLQDIADVGKELKKIEEKREKTHKDGKEASWLICTQWDAANRDFKKMMAPIIESFELKWSNLCREIKENQDKIAKEKKRVDNIKTKIESNALSFATNISNCETVDELLAIERSINLEKTRTKEYDEFLLEAIERFNLLNESLKTQKSLLREFNKVDDLDEEGKESLLTKIEEHKISVQEDTITAFTRPAQVNVAHAIYPTVKARRTTWEIELVDTKEALKKAPNLLEITLNKDAAKIVLQALKDANVIGKDVKDYTSNGIRYYEKQVF